MSTKKRCEGGFFVGRSQQLQSLHAKLREVYELGKLYKVSRMGRYGCDKAVEVSSMGVRVWIEKCANCEETRTKVAD